MPRGNAEWHQGEFFPRVGFIVTNFSKRAKNLVKFYSGRGTAQQWIQEGNNAVKWTKLSAAAACSRRPSQQSRSPTGIHRLPPE